MAAIRRIASTSALANAALIRDNNSSSHEVRESLQALGEELGGQIVSALYGNEASNSANPDGSLVELRIPQSMSAVITTKNEVKFFGRGLAARVRPAVTGYMNFEGRRGYEVLDAPIRDMDIPDLGVDSIDVLIVGKSILASGCTAVTLARAAIREYRPHKVVIASIFYSLDGLQELRKNLPEAFVYVVGEPASVDASGSLGIRMIEELL